MKSRLVTILIFLIIPIQLISADAEDQLREAISAFWQANEARDRVTSMKYVHPDDLNIFLNKNAAVIKKWEIDSISLNPEWSEAEVKIKYSMETYPGIAFNLNKNETWQLVGDEWKVRVPDPSIAMKNALFGNPEASLVGSEEKTLKIKPESIRFYKTNTSQPAFIWIENGLDIPVSLTLLEVDQSLIEVAEKPEQVNPGEKARIKLLYIGSEKQKENLL